MSECYIYDVRSPKSGGHPVRFEVDFWEADEICQEVLGRFTESQLIEATYQYDLFLYRSSDLNFSPDQYLTEDTEADYAGGYRAGYVRSSICKKRPPEDVIDLPNVTWAEIFGLLSLSTLVFACRDEKRMEKAGINEEEILWRVGRYAIETMKLAMTALVYQASNNIAVDLDKYRNRVARKGGQGKASKIEPLKKAVFAMYEAEHSDRSNRDAARRIWNKLSESDKCDDQGRPYLTTDDPMQRLAVWIGQYKRTLE